MTARETDQHTIRPLSPCGLCGPWAGDHLAEQTVAGMALLLERRDPATAAHQRRVAQIAAAAAEALGLPPPRGRALRLAAQVHDVGKIAVPTEILSKPGPLTTAERLLLSTHAEVGWELLSVLPFSAEVAEIVRQHHERLDGSGYPRRLRGDDILEEARVLAVADVVDAMTSHRPYRPALGFEAAAAHLLAGRGSLFDPSAVDACIEVSRPALSA